MRRGLGKAGTVRRREAGQALLEFTIMLAMMLSVFFTLSILLGVLDGYSWRILSLVGLKYP